MVNLYKVVGEGYKSLLDIGRNILHLGKLQKGIDDSLKSLHSMLNIIYTDKHGTTITRLPFTVEVPEGYELPKYNEETGHAEYSDGTIAEHIELRKIQY